MYNIIDFIIDMYTDIPPISIIIAGVVYSLVYSSIKYFDLHIINYKELGHNKNLNLNIL